jgi:RNA polymerase primary sigma factor
MSELATQYDDESWAEDELAEPRNPRVLELIMGGQISEALEPEVDYPSQVQDEEPVVEVDLSYNDDTTDSLKLFLRDIRRTPLLTAPEEIVLAKRIERGDEAAKEQMVLANLRLVVAIAKNYRGYGLPFLDLIQEGTFGLNKAADRFDWRRGCKFSTFATDLIGQSCQQAIIDKARTIRLPEHVVHRLRRMNKAENTLWTRLGREPNLDEIARESKFSHQKVKNVQGVANASVSLGQGVGALNETEIGDLFADPKAEDPSKIDDESIRSDALEKILECLSDRERNVLGLRYGLNGQEPKTQKQVSIIIGRNKSRVHQIENEAMERLRAFVAQDSLEDDLRNT